MNGSYFINNTKIANLIRVHNDLAGKKVNTKVEKTRENEDVFVTFKISEDLTNFDMDVADAIYTMYKKKMEIITPTGVLRVLSGDDNQAVKTGYNKEIIMESIEKLRRTVIVIECKEQMQNRKDTNEIFQIEEGKIYIGGYSFLVADRVPGREKYRIKQYKEEERVNTEKYYKSFFMPLYGYMEVLKQVIAIPQILLEIKDSTTEKYMTNSIENIQIKRYMIRRLEVRRKNPKKEILEEKIAYYYESHKKGREGDLDGMFPAIGINEEDYHTKESWKHKRQKTHAKVELILKYYEEIGYIKEYSVSQTDSRRLYGVEVKLNPDNSHNLI